MAFSETEMMKARFAKLLLGEDMSGGGNGFCTALAISNAITNLSATVFGELWRLEPLTPEKKTIWKRDMEWLLCVSDSIVELNPSLQEFPGCEGRTIEVMVAQPRSDLYVNLSALKKLDALLVGILDDFQDMEFWYVDRDKLLGDAELNLYPSSGRPSAMQEEKWWLPCPRVPPRVPPKGLSNGARERLQQCKERANQILNAAKAINDSTLAEMEIPDAYLERLPKTEKSCLGDVIYTHITAEEFSPEGLLKCLDISSDHHTLEIADRIEAAIHVWNHKNQAKHSIKAKTWKRPWGGKVKALIGYAGKSHLLAQRAENLLQCLRHWYPGLPQTALDRDNIQYNKDVGKSILESYSRVLESLAFNIMARIDDLIYVDDMSKYYAESASLFGQVDSAVLPTQRRESSSSSIDNSPGSSPFFTPTYCPSTPVGGSPGREKLFP